MTVLDEVIPVHNKVSLSQRYLRSGSDSSTSGTGSGHSSGEGGGKKRKYGSSAAAEDPHSALYEELRPKRTTRAMLNGGYKDHHQHHHHHHHNTTTPAPTTTNSPTTSIPAVATLANLGNTCYLNSVLYALRFAPTFLHRLHHLVADLDSVSGVSYGVGSGGSARRMKSASLGRNVPVGGMAGVGGRSTSTRDLVGVGGAEQGGCGGGIGLMPKMKVHVVTEKLHELFLAMRIIEEKKRDGNDAYQPNEFLQAVRDANSIFEGNQQQDAHELLVYLLDNLRETCDMVHYTNRLTDDLTSNNATGSNPTIANCPPTNSTTNLNPSATTTTTAATTTTTTTSAPSSTKTSGSASWWSKMAPKKSKDKGSGSKKDAISEEVVGGGGGTDTDTEGGGSEVEGGGGGMGESGGSSGSTPVLEKKRYNNFMAEEFEGITLRRTKCLECESVTERKELFYDIPVPINCNEDEAERQKLNPSDVYRLACVTTEKLCDSNKYLCDRCSRYNEASREVSFAKLPNILILQLKRFATTATGSSAGVVQKVHADMPTPLRLACFCEGCCRKQTNHKYRLCCVIMHLGGTLQSGHYIAYVRVPGGGCGDFKNDYVECNRDPPKGTMSASTSEKSLNIFKRLKSNSKAQFDATAKVKNTTTTIHNTPPRCCKSQQCCGVRINRLAVEGTVLNAVNASNGYGRRYDYETTDDNAHSGSADDDNDIWLECDDDNVKSITKFELQKSLSGAVNPTSTPYLLFYAKIPDAVND